MSDLVTVSIAEGIADIRFKQGIFSVITLAPAVSAAIQL